MNSRKNQTIVQGIFWLLGIVGLFYAASRTLHFVENTMPSGDKINGYLYLFFTGAGAFLWAQVYLKHAIGATRRAVSFMLAVGDLLAELILVYADTQFVANANGLVKMSDSELKTFITATVGIVGLNLIGWFIYHLNDPEHRKAGMAQDLADEVEEATYKQLNTPAERQVMINNLMPTYGTAIIAEVTRTIHERAGYQPVKGTPFETPFTEPKKAETALVIPQGDRIPQPTEAKQDEPFDWLRLNQGLESIKQDLFKARDMLTGQTRKDEPIAHFPKHWCERCKKETEDTYLGDCAECLHPRIKQDEQPSAPAPFPGQADSQSDSSGRSTGQD